MADCEARGNIHTAWKKIQTHKHFSQYIYISDGATDMNFSPDDEGGLSLPLSLWLALGGVLY